MLSRLMQTTADEWKHWACSQRDKGPGSGTSSLRLTGGQSERSGRSCMLGMTSLLQPRSSRQCPEEPVLCVSQDNPDSGCEQTAMPRSPWHGTPAVSRAASRGFSAESMQLCLAARDSSVECCPDSLDAFDAFDPPAFDPPETNHRKERHSQDIDKCCRDLRVALSKQRQEGRSEAVGALRRLERQCDRQTSIDDDNSQRSQSCDEESDSDEAIDRKYEQAEKGKTMCIARNVARSEKQGARLASTDERADSSEPLTSKEVQAYQELMQEKFHRLGQHSSRPLCPTGNPRDAVCDAVSRFYDVSNEIDTYYAMPGERHGGIGLSYDQHKCFSRYSHCLAHAQATPTERPVKRPSASMPSVQAKPKAHNFGIF